MELAAAGKKATMRSAEQMGEGKKESDNQSQRPTRKTDVWGTQLHLKSQRLGHPPVLGSHIESN
jgi:hypothetical protein